MHTKDKEYTHTIVNSAENYAILGQTGVGWWEENETATILTIGTSTQTNLERLVEAIRTQSSDPFPPGYPTVVQGGSE